jgi:murein L,D-transpeptidase YcbB/YkuD
MRVAAGTKEDPTPIFSERMTHVVFSPYWHVPPRIAREEWIPEAVHDPDYLRRNGLEVIKEGRVVDPRKVDWNDEDLRLRQRPGAENILGLVKFVFPNRFHVYLHDTPFESDFHRAARDKSHGCVRMEEPVELARWVLRGQNQWNRKRIEEAMHAGTEEQVEIEKPVPVYLIYQTAWVAENGSVRFSDDPYDYDAAQLALLERRATRGSLAPYDDDASSTGTVWTSGASGSLAPVTGPTHRGVNPGLPRRTCAAARFRLSSKEKPRNLQDQNMARKWF